MTVQELREKMAEDGRKYGMVLITKGVFGELDNCAGMVELPIIYPPEGGVFVKYYGCSYLLKGDLDEQKIIMLEQAKSNISTLPREIIGKSFLYSFVIVLRYIFQRKRFINDLHIFFEEIRWKTMRHINPPEKHFNQFAVEIRRAMAVAVRKEFDLAPDFDLYNDTSPQSGKIKYTFLDMAGLIAKITAFITLIMQKDCAYRFPIQDVLGEKNTENTKRSGYCEVMRLFDIMIARQTNLTQVDGVSEITFGVLKKYRFLKMVLRLVLLTSPTIRRIMQNFLIELDAGKVALDDADWYFCLQRNLHNYRGMSLPERLAEKKRIDKEKEHIILTFQQKT